MLRGTEPSLSTMLPSVGPVELTSLSNSRLVTTLEALFANRGVMDQAEICDEASEIRLLGRTTLQAIDTMRTDGFGVSEIVEL